MNNTMWHFISERISSALDTPFIVQHRTAASGGDTHQSFVIRDDRKRFFVKIHPLDGARPLQAEAEGLHALAKIDGVTVPDVITSGDIHVEGSDFEYLVLAHLRFCDFTSESQAALGGMLATLHKATGFTRYGWPHDNFIGATEQVNTQSDNWAAFFAHQRIGAMLDRLHDQGIDLGQPDDITHSVENVLADHQPTPALLHGDLWSGNAGATRHGPVIFDPAVYVGDPEADLAMTELFGGFTRAFYQAYERVRPISPDYPTRKPIYQLYHILNHALLFGGSYVQQASAIIAALKK